MSHDLLLTNIRPMGGAPTDMLIRAGRIAGLGANLTAPGIQPRMAAARWPSPAWWKRTPISTNPCSAWAGARIRPARC